MKNPDQIRLCLFFTAGVGLADWKNSGSLEREVALYRQLATSLGGIDFVTYGAGRDEALAGEVPGIGILSSAWRRRQGLTALEIALRHSRSLARASVFKTNQVRGAQVPVWLNRIYHKKLIVRCGFLHAWFTRRQTDDPRRIREAVELERRAFNAADRVVVTSGWQRELVCEDYNLPPDKVRVIPNYVQTDLFRPLETVEKKYDLVYVGRGSAQKNLEGLLDALARLKAGGENVSALLVGGCSEDPGLRERAARLGLDIHWSSNRPAAELPSIINSGRAFILPSFYEGHPKSLLEAMSCGAACIGTDVPGIREDLSHGKNGWLCRSDPESLAAAVHAVLSNGELRRKLSRGAGRYIRDLYSLEQVTGQEMDLIRELASEA